MKNYFIFVVFFAFIMLPPTAEAAERFTSTPVTGETITLFGAVYSVNGIDVTTANWPGTGTWESAGPNEWCGIGMGWKPGVTEAGDTLLLVEECGGGPGEDAYLLTGVSAAPDYEPGPAVTTASYINNSPGSNRDPSAVEWINDDNIGAATDPNIRFGLGVVGQVIAYDTDTLPRADDWTVNYQDQDAMPSNGGTWAGSPWGKPVAGCKDEKTGAATRYFLGCVNKVGEPLVGAFAYYVFDLTADAFLTSYPVNLTALGEPDELREWEEGRDLRALAFDGSRYYVFYRPPGTDEAWLARYETFPDSADAAVDHDEVPQTVRMDDPAGGVSWNDDVSRPDRVGMACGRMVNLSGRQYPVIYILCDHFLYTLAPRSLVGVSTDVGEEWEDYR
jgi:hypothetical protein